MMAVRRHLPDLSPKFQRPQRRWHRGFAWAHDVTGLSEQAWGGCHLAFPVLSLTYSRFWMPSRKLIPLANWGPWLGGLFWSESSEAGNSCFLCFYPY
jgi:hypothetical protein